MISAVDEYLSFLMGADNISDEELSGINVKVIERIGSHDRGLLIPSISLEKFKNLICQKLLPRFWNEIVGQKIIIFIFKNSDGTIQEF